jgi:DNA-binding response OmpR family regulator
MAGVIKAAGIDAECARSVGEALVELEMGLKPAAVILDLNLPDADGSIVLWRVRRNWGRDVPVAVVTGMPELLSRADMVREPPDIVFTKPIHFGSLVAWLKSVT